MELLVTAILITLLVVGLDRNRHRQGESPHHLAGSTDVVDRDIQRTIGELFSAR